VTSLNLTLLAIGLVALALDAMATLEVTLSPFVRREQFFRNLALIWLVPIAGAVICLLRARRHYRGSNTPTDSDSFSDAADLIEVRERPRNNLASRLDESVESALDDD